MGLAGQPLGRSTPSIVTLGPALLYTHARAHPQRTAPHASTHARAHTHKPATHCPRTISNPRCARLGSAPPPPQLPRPCGAAASGPQARALALARAAGPRGRLQHAGPRGDPDARRPPQSSRLVLPLLKAVFFMNENVVCK